MISGILRLIKIEYTRQIPIIDKSKTINTCAHWICSLLGCYAVCSGNSLPTFRDHLSVPSSMVNKYFPLNIGPMDYPETSVINYHYMLHNVPEERRFHLLRCRSLKAFISVDCTCPDCFYRHHTSATDQLHCADSYIHKLMYILPGYRCSLTMLQIWPCNTGHCSNIGCIYTFRDVTVK